MEGDFWEFPSIGIPELRVHPAHLTDDADVLLIEMWRAFTGGLGGRGPLPFAGGYADQPACVMAAFRILSNAEDALNPKGKTDGRT